MVAIFFSASSRFAAISDGRACSKFLLETAFALNAVLIGGVILIFAAYGMGWIPHASLSPETLGALTAMALLEVTFGLALAAWLLIAFREKSRRLYFSVLTVHIVEVGILGSVFLLCIKS